MQNISIVIISPLSRDLFSGNQSVRVEIYKLEGESRWCLEVIDEYNNSTVWDDTFETDSDALNEAQRIIRDDGICALIGPEGDEEWE
tara:strand:- start:1291 stop:1551 length:261 start_codon:yes stop_codon:yes gene_type:complete